MKMLNVIIFVLLGLVAFQRPAAAITIPIEFEKLVENRQDIYRLKITASNAHSYVYDSKEYVCAIEYNATIIETFKGSAKKNLKFVSRRHLKTGGEYLVFLGKTNLNDGAKENSLTKAIKKIIESKGNEGYYDYGYESNSSKPIGSPEGRACVAPLKSNRLWSLTHSEIFEFYDINRKMIETEWVRYDPKSRTIKFSTSVRVAIFNLQCNLEEKKYCPYPGSIILVSWKDLRKAIMEVVD